MKLLYHEIDTVFVSKGNWHHFLLYKQPNPIIISFNHSGKIKRGARLNPLNRAPLKKDLSIVYSYPYRLSNVRGGFSENIFVRKILKQYEYLLQQPQQSLCSIDIARLFHYDRSSRSVCFFLQRCRIHKFIYK